MKTDDLIRVLAADTLPEPPVSGRLWSVLLPAVVVTLLANWLALGLRPDLVQALGNPVSLMRFVLTCALAAVSMRIALGLARPEGRGVVRFWPLAVVAGAALAMLIWAYVATPAEARQMATVGKTMWVCLVFIPILSVVPVATLFWALRRGATTAPALAGAVIGLAGSGIAATIYATHCTEDSPLFYITWYSLAIMGVTMVSAAIGARVLRW